MDSKHLSSTKLDVDESIIHSQLKINRDEEEFEDLLNVALGKKKMTDDNFPFKTVKPKPGFCVKTKDLKTSTKIFLNLCHTDVIPAPPEVSESELTKILESDEPTTFRIPMSLGEGHEEIDKSGQPCMVYDVAINSTFIEKVEGSLLFQTFLITIAMEGLDDKYNLELDKNGWTILKNRRCFGSLTMHRIEQRHQKPLVQEVPKPEQLERNQTRKLIEEVEPASKLNSKNELPKADCSLMKTKEGTEIIVARIRLLACDPDDLELCVIAEKNLMLRDSNGQQIAAAALPRAVDTHETKAIFNSSSKIMTVLLPVIHCSA